ncbi:MAG: rhodanese-related sulfurtransferase [Paraglaciecola psychrophila]|jgi:rhodanese-related sulfurtransferase
MAIKNIFDSLKEITANIDNITVDQLKAEMANNSNLLLLDIRELQELVDKGSIAGAKHAPRGMLEFWADPSSPYSRDWFQEDRRTVVFCAGGGRSVLAVKALEGMGFSNVAQLQPGFGGWVEAGEPITDFAATSRWVRR